ncbi:hypothetical protein ACOMHN_037217 [Nucella lapillus]
MTMNVHGPSCPSDLGHQLERKERHRLLGQKRTEKGVPFSFCLAASEAESNVKASATKWQPSIFHFGQEKGINLPSAAAAAP